MVTGMADDMVTPGRVCEVIQAIGQHYLTGTAVDAREEKEKDADCLVSFKYRMIENSRWRIYGSTVFGQVRVANFEMVLALLHSSVS